MSARLYVEIVAFQDGQEVQHQAARADSIEVASYAAAYNPKIVRIRGTEAALRAAGCESGKPGGPLTFFYEDLVRVGGDRVEGRKRAVLCIVENPARCAHKGCKRDAQLGRFACAEHGELVP